MSKQNTDPNAQKKKREGTLRQDSTLNGQKRKREDTLRQDSTLNGQKKERYLSLRLAGVLLVLTVILLTVAVSSSLASILNRTFHLHISINTVGWILLFALAVGTIGALVAVQFFIKPVKQLEAAMNEVTQGNFNVRLQNRKPHLREIDSLYENFDLMTRALSSTEILQTDFVSNVSHEFKTPIASIEGYTALLQDPCLNDADRAEYTEKILLATRRLSQLVGNILLISKVENTAIAPPSETFRLDEQIRRTLILAQSAWNAKSLDISAQLDPVSYTGNPGLLIHVWSNLIDNAIKFTPDGGSIALRLRQENGMCIFETEDSGPGIREEDLPFLFDKFYQGDASHKAAGNGLGLALVKKIASVAGGTATAENTGHGALFTVRLPLAQPENE